MVEARSVNVKKTTTTTTTTSSNYDVEIKETCITRYSNRRVVQHISIRHDSCLFVFHTISYIIYHQCVTTAGGVRDRTASGINSGIYLLFWGLRIRTRGKRGSPKRTCLQHNSDVQDTGIYLKVDGFQLTAACGCRGACISKNDWTKGRGFNESEKTKTKQHINTTRRSILLQ